MTVVDYFESVVLAAGFDSVAAAAAGAGVAAGGALSAGGFVSGLVSDFASSGLGETPLVFA